MRIIRNPAPGDSGAHRMYALFLLLLFVPIAAGAATDGTSGVTSTGTASITLTVPPMVRIAGMKDMELGTWADGNDKTGNYDVCIYTNLAGGRYRVTATGTGNSFHISSDGNTLPYHVYWNDQTGTSGQVEISPGTSLTDQTTENVSSPKCSSSTADFQIKFLSSDLANAVPGAYSGQISFLVEAN